MSIYRKMKNKSKSKSLLDTIKNQEKKTDYVDHRFWTFKPNEKHNTALIRFLNPVIDLESYCGLSVGMTVNGNPKLKIANFDYDADGNDLKLTLDGDTSSIVVSEIFAIDDRNAKFEVAYLNGQDVYLDYTGGDPFISYLNVFCRHVGSDGNTNFYIEKSLDLFGMKDPAKEKWQHYLTKYINGGKINKDDQEMSNKFKAHPTYVANILVINDPINPENNGKVMLYQFGKIIFDKIKAKQEDEYSPINPFDWEEGCDFKLVITQLGEGKKKKTDYSSSEWQLSNPIRLAEKTPEGKLKFREVNDESELELILSQTIPLDEFVVPHGKDSKGRPHYKSYDELRAKIDNILGSQNKAHTVEDMELSNDHSNRYEKPPTRRDLGQSQTVLMDDDYDMPWDNENDSNILDDEVPF